MLLNKLIRLEQEYDKSIRGKIIDELMRYNRANYIFRPFLGSKIGVTFIKKLKGMKV